MSFLEELKRRNVVRVGLAYAVVAWLVLQVADIVFEAIGTPAWVMQTLLVVLAIGGVLTLFIAWAFELTPEGLKREEDVDRSAPAARGAGRKLDFVIIAGLVLAAGYFFWESRLADREHATTASTGQTSEGRTAIPATTSQADRPASPERSVAVLPFVNMSSDAEKEYFSDGITEEIINAVVKIPGVSVPARTTVFAYKGHQRDLREVGLELGVSHILEGSIRSQDDQVRITAQLIEVKDGFHLWSDTFDRRLDNIFAVQEEIATAIARQLTGELQGGVTTVPNRTRDMRAYDLYLQGRAALRQRADVSRELLHAAIEADPDFAPAWAALAIAYQSTNEDNDMALEMAEQALALDPDNVDALNAKGAALRTQRRWLEAESFLEQALAIDPNSAELLEDYAEFLAYTGRSAEALNISTRGIELDPALLPLSFAHAEALLANDRPDDAYAYALDLVASHPELPWLWVAMMPVWMDPDNRAEHAELPTRPAFSGPAWDAELANAIALLDELAALASRVYSGTSDEQDRQALRGELAIGTGPFSPLVVHRTLLVALGETDFVIEQDIAQFDSTGTPMNEWAWTPVFRPVRRHPRFSEFLERAGLMAYWDATRWPEGCVRGPKGEVRCE